MTDLAASGVIQSSKGTRERVFRLTPGSLPFLDRDVSAPDWINWPSLLSAAERVWHLTEELCATKMEPQVVESEISLALAPIFERLARAPWMLALRTGSAAIGIAPLCVFHSSFASIAL